MRWVAPTEKDTATGTLEKHPCVSSIEYMIVPVGEIGDIQVVMTIGVKTE